MYNTKQNVNYMLYDKEQGRIVRYFKDMYEIRDFIKSKIEFSNSVLFGSMCFELSVFNTDYILKDLSMDFKKRYRNVRFGFDDYRNIAHKHLVIVDNNGRIFNYSEIVCELVAIHRGNRINFGIGKTYKGNPNTPKDWKNRPITYRCRLGTKMHSKGSGSYNLIVNKRERVNSKPNFHGDAVYEDIVEEIEETSNVSVSVNMIKAAYNNMREDRRNLANHIWEDGYTDHYYKYGRPESWKNHKKTRQWHRGKNRQRLISKYDSLIIDEEVA